MHQCVPVYCLFAVMREIERITLFPAKVVYIFGRGYIFMYVYGTDLRVSKITECEYELFGLLVPP